MQAEQAQFIMNWLLKDQKASISISAEKNETSEMFNEMQEFIQMFAENLHTLYLAVQRLEWRPQNLENGSSSQAQPAQTAPFIPEPAAEPLDNSSSVVGEQIDRQLRTMKALLEQFQRQQVLTDKLTSQIEVRAAAIAEKGPKPIL